MTNTAPILEVHDLVKDFGGVRAVDHCSLRIKRGAITGIIGPNGAGKTTLFNLVSGAMSPTSGQVIFDGRRIDKMGMHQTFGLGLVRTFQIPREMKRMTVLENLMLVPAPQTGEHIWASWLMPLKVAREERRIEVQAMEVLELTVRILVPGTPLTEHRGCMGHVLRTLSQPNGGHPQMEKELKTRSLEPGSRTSGLVLPLISSARPKILPSFTPS